MNYSKYLTHKIFDIIKEIKQEQDEVYVIGGFVRDLILQRKSKDIDIMIVGDGVELAQRVANKIHFNKEVSIFKRYGTAMIKMKDYQIEFVGARKESYTSNSRNPEVEKGTLQDDQNRRDFTINTLAISLNNIDYGELLDPFGGIADLENKIIKTPLNPDITFSDDPLRILRAIRFATQLNFSIEEQTFLAIARNKERLSIISKNRINDELNKIILSIKPSIGFYLLDKAGVLGIIFPEFVKMKGIEIIDGKAHKDNFHHTLKVLDNIAKLTDNLWLRWAAIMHDIAKPRTKRFDKNIGWTFHTHDFLGAKMTEQIFRKMQMPTNDKMRYVQNLVALHLRPIFLVEDVVSDSAIRRLIFEAGKNIDDLMDLCEADITSGDDKKVQKYLQNINKVREKIIELEEKDKIRNFQPPITGEEIIKIFNLKPSKQIGVIKNAIKEAILDGTIANNYQEAYDFMMIKAREIGLNS